MARHSTGTVRRLLGTTAMGLAFLAATGAPAQEIPIVQPGAPGQAGRQLSAEEATRIAVTRFSPDDVAFMQAMIPHHAQAVQMAVLVKDRTNRPEIVELAGRIDKSQADEIAFMQQWLRDRGETVPDAAHSHGHSAHTHMKMAGMATPEQMQRLAAASGTDFDRLFLELMIPHHKGAVTMVEELLEKDGSAFDPVLFDFVNGIVNDQAAEIERMNAVLSSLSPDPRATLTAGYLDAGAAVSNMALVASLPRPPGFFDPTNPLEITPEKPKAAAAKDAAKDDKAEGKPAHDHHGGHHGGHHDGHHDDRREAQAAAAANPQPAGPAAAEAKTGEKADEKTGEKADEKAEEPARGGDDGNDRFPARSFGNTDIAFFGDKLVAGNYHGFNIYRLDAKGVPVLYSSVVCPGGQGDVSIVGNLLIMSVEETRARVDCGLQGVPEEVSPDRFRGLRIFDISNPAQPVQVGQVQTCRGSHTHSVVSGPGSDGRIIVYNSGISSVRDERELPGCVGDVPGDARTALFRIDVIEIPVNDPAKARIVDSPAVFADPQTGRLSGLWPGGDHGDETQDSARTDHCHDITVFPALKIAAGACSGNGVVFDITDPLSPRRIDAATDRGFAYWHSATFNNDGTKVLFTDEWGGGVRARCRTHDPRTWGANAIFDLVGGKALEFRSYYKLPGPQAEQENCVAHNGAIVPVPGRDIFVQAWYQGGISVIDFTDSANPVEIAYFDRGPLDPKRKVLGGFWSAYWYKGRIYATEIIRGLDVLELTASEHLSANELAAAALADQGAVVNPQRQVQVTWPADPVVARAYMDQLARGRALPEAIAAPLTTALDRAAARLTAGERDPALAGTLEELARRLAATGAEAPATKRMAALGDTLTGIATRLR